MTKQRRTFSAEFKMEAASLVLDDGYSVPAAARSIGVGELLYGAGLTNSKLNAVG